MSPTKTNNENKHPPQRKRPTAQSPKAQRPIVTNANNERTPQEKKKKQTPTDPSEHFTIRAPLEASFKHKSSNPKQLIRNAQKHQNGNKTPKFVDVGIVVGIFLAAGIFDMYYFAYKVFL